MHLLRASEVKSESGGSVFRYSRLNATLLTLLLLVFAATCLLFGYRQPAGVTRYVSYYIGAAFLLGLFFLRGSITARFRAGNWLAWVVPAGVFIKFRSYLNYALPDADETVVFIPYQEIRSAGLLSERWTAIDSQGHHTTGITRYAELDVSTNLNALAAALSAERRKPALKRKRWYGTTSSLYHHYPVRVVLPSLIQVQWSATPGRRTFLKTLSPFVQIAPPVHLSKDFSRLTTQTPEQQQQHLRELDAAGQTLLAISTARRLYGYDLAAAKAFVESLRNNE